MIVCSIHNEVMGGIQSLSRYRQSYSINYIHEPFAYPQEQLQNINEEKSGPDFDENLEICRCISLFVITHLRRFGQDALIGKSFCSMTEFYRSDQQCKKNVQCCSSIKYTLYAFGFWEESSVALCTSSHF